MSHSALNSIDEAVQAIKDGEMIIVVDDEDRENEGDIILSAQLATPEKINFIIKEARGLLCTPMPENRAKNLGLDIMVQNSSEKWGTAFTISVDSVKATTGISAHERCETVRLLADPQSKIHDFEKPGHVFPLVAQPGGVLKRAGHTEAAVDLMNMAELEPVGVICEILNDDGTMARLPQLIKFAKKHNLKIISVAQLIQHRAKEEIHVWREAEATLPSKYGTFQIIVYGNDIDHKDHVAIVKGDISKAEEVPIRVHSECLTGDILGSYRCDCGDQLHQALEFIDKNGLGVVLYMRQEGRGIGLVNKIRAYALQDQGLDTVEANVKLGFAPDLRDYGIGAQILKELGVHKIQLMTNNPKKLVGLQGYGLQVTQRLPIIIPPNPHNQNYLKTKETKMGHIYTQKSDTVSKEGDYSDITDHQE